MRQRTHRASAQGFTVVELMIATSIFAAILLLMTFGLLQVGRTYYKGLTISRTQTAARGIMDQIAQSIQFSGGLVTTTDGKDSPDGTTYAFCVNTTRYTYILDREVVEGSPNTSLHQTNHALVTDTPVGSCDASTSAYGDLTTVLPGGLINSGPQQQTELLSPFMRLATLTIKQDHPPSTILYDITVKVVYGDDDLLDSSHSTCLGTAGDQFCAVSQLSTVVEKRLPN